MNDKIRDYIDICTISGHLQGIADGLSWHINEDNKKALEHSIHTLQADSERLMNIARKIPIKYPE